jgi:hypothetical protein
MVGDQPRRDVGRPTGREGDNDAKGSAGPFALRARDSRQRERRGGGKQATQNRAAMGAHRVWHRFLLWSFSAPLFGKVA